MKKDNHVLSISLAITALIVAWGLIGPKSFESAANASFSYLVTNFGWFYLLTMTSFVVFSIWLAVSKYGKIKLGPDDSVPDYSYGSWFAMLFSAGMGIGLVFWGIAEPLNHYVNPLGMAGGTPEAADFAIRKAFFHWGLHPWANYSVMALALAYMQFRKGKPGLVSSIFIPLLGEERVAGPIGKTIDILAVFATVAGVATSLGIGALQINSGLNYLFGIPESNTVIIIIVAVITLLFVGTAVAGLDKGIKLICDANIVIAALILVATLIIGPTLLILNTFTNGIGNYLQQLMLDSFRIDPYGSNEWYGWWTVFYWAWWIAWAPFCGVFIARISRGRTIREFVTGVLLAPSLASFIWFSVFGSTAINTGIATATEAIKSTPTAFFVIMDKYPMGSVISFVAVVLLITFFVTSANSATFVLGMLTEHGNMNPSKKGIISWGIIQSGLALVLMLAGANGLSMLQTASIVAAFPFAFVMIFGMVSIVKALKEEDHGLEGSVVKHAVEKKESIQVIERKEANEYS